MQRWVSRRRRSDVLQDETRGTEVDRLQSTRPWSCICSWRIVFAQMRILWLAIVCATFGCGTVRSGELDRGKPGVDAPEALVDRSLRNAPAAKDDRASPSLHRVPAGPYCGTADALCAGELAACREVLEIQVRVALAACTTLQDPRASTEAKGDAKKVLTNVMEELKILGGALVPPEHIIGR